MNPYDWSADSPEQRQLRAGRWQLGAGDEKHGDFMWFNVISCDLILFNVIYNSI